MDLDRYRSPCMMPSLAHNGTNCTCHQMLERMLKERRENDEGSDATWILSSAFIIFTMQSGFGLLEAGSVSAKNEANIMIKNAIDIIFGALSFWICGFAFSFGNDATYRNEFTGYGLFFTDSKKQHYGYMFAKYFFQLSFSTTATTIVSGAMAERTNLKAYILYSSVNFISYVFPAHWLWDENGFLSRLGVVDIAGCGPVHLTGGVAALVATVMLKPRTGVFDADRPPRQLASATNLVLGTFMLWWGWLGLNCGSTLGVSGGKWKLASRTAVVTINGSVGGGIWSILYCYFLTKDYGGKLDIPNFTECILGGLVSITSICAICSPWEALIIGFAGGMACSYGSKLLVYLEIDDPVSCIPVHLLCGTFGVIVVGLSGMKETEEGLAMHNGVFRGGPWFYLGYQILACVVIAAWSAGTTFIQLYLIDKLLGLRISVEDELVGADFVEHGIEPEDEQLNINTDADRTSVTEMRRSLYTKRRMSTMLQSSCNCPNSVNHVDCDNRWTDATTLYPCAVLDRRGSPTLMRQSSYPLKDSPTTIRRSPTTMMSNSTGPPHDSTKVGKSRPRVTSVGPKLAGDLMTLCMTDGLDDGLTEERIHNAVDVQLDDMKEEKCGEG